MFWYTTRANGDISLLMGKDMNTDMGHYLMTSLMKCLIVKSFIP